MNPLRHSVRMISHFVLLALAACGGGGGDAGGTSGGITPTNESPGGIWQGTESVSGLTVLGLVDESGDLHFLRSDGVQYVGKANTHGTSITADIEGFVPLGASFPDGSTHGTGSVSGTIQARSLINLTTHFRTDAGANTDGTLNLTFNSLYNRASAIGTIAGNFINPANGVVVTVSSDGRIFSQDPSSGCVLNGTVSIINASYNAYHIEYYYANCTGQSAILNGSNFAGIGTLDNTVSPDQAIVGVTGTAGNTKLTIIYVLNRS